MGKYDRFSRTAPMKPRPWKIHPIWRGIGCIMMLLVPLMAYAGAVLLVDENLKQGWVALPRESLQVISLPVLGPVANFYAVLATTILLMLLGFGLITILYAIIYSLVGPPRLGPMDAPPLRGKVKRSR